MTHEQSQPTLQLETWKQLPEYPGFRAMAARDMQENERTRELVSGGADGAVQGADKGLLYAVATDVMAGYYLEMTSGNADEFDFTGMCETIVDTLDDEAVDKMVENDPAGPDRLSTDQARELMKGIFKGFESFIPKTGTPGYTGPEYYRSRYEAAQALAEERGVSTATVFQADEFYEELVRRVDTPEELAERQLGSLQRLSNEGMMAFAKNMLKTLAVLEGGGEVTEEAEQELLDDPDFKEQIQAMTAHINVRIPLVIKSQLTRFWGEGAYDALPAKLRQQIDSLADQKTEA